MPAALLNELVFDARYNSALVSEACGYLALVF